MRNRILVVDDDETARQEIAEILRAQGYVVATADTGDPVISALETHAPDLVLLDLHSSDADSCALLERIKTDARWSDLPVMIVSTQQADDGAEHIFRLGAVDHLRKPIQSHDLLARVQVQLRMRAVIARQREALRIAEQELQRAREDAESRRKLMEILHEVTGELSTDEIYHVLARRVARALSLSRCSVILANPGASTGVVATAFDAPALRNERIDLARYPEIQAALTTGQPVLVEDLQTDPLFENIRRMWETNGTRVPVRSVIALPFRLDQQQGGVFFLRRLLDEPALTPEDVDFADAVIRAAGAAIQRARVIEAAQSENARLEELACTDGLTQVLNRRALTARLVTEVNRARRYDATLSILMIDLDHFKFINDRYGHLVGDEVLREVAVILRQAIRSTDIVARYGGEEFVVLLPETSLLGAVTFADRLRTLIGAFGFAVSTEAGPIQVTASIGVTMLRNVGTASAQDLLARADEALYRAKDRGRNTVST